MKTQICLHLLSISLCSFRVSWLDSIGSRITIISKVQYLSVGLDQERGISVSDGSHDSAVGSFWRWSCCYSAALTDWYSAASACTEQVCDPKLHHFAMQHLYVCVASSCCSFCASCFPPLLAQRWPHSGEQWRSFSQSSLCPLGCSCLIQVGRQILETARLGNLVIVLEQQDSSANLNYLSADFSKILSWVWIYHSCTPWFMVSGSLPKIHLLRFLFSAPWKFQVGAGFTCVAGRASLALPSGI